MTFEKKLTKNKTSQWVRSCVDYIMTSALSLGVQSLGSKWKNTNQLVYFAGAWLHFVVNHNFHSLEDFVSSAAAAFFPESAASLEQLCQQRVTQTQRQERKMWALPQINVLATGLPFTIPPTPHNNNKKKLYWNGLTAGAWITHATLRRKRLDQKTASVSQNKTWPQREKNGVPVWLIS